MELNIVSVGFFSGGIWQIIGQTSLFGLLILVLLVMLSLISWSIMFNKWRMFRKVEEESWAFLNLYRKAGKISEMPLKRPTRLTKQSPAGLCGMGITGPKSYISLVRTWMPGLMSFPAGSLL